MHDVDTTQRQIQEQKFKVHGGGAGHWIGDVLRYGFLFFLTIVGIMVFLWVFGGENGKDTDIGIWFVLAVAALWWVYHSGRWVKNKADRAALDAHFHDVSPLLSVGDRTTEGYIPYFVPQIESADVKEEPHQDIKISPYAKPILSMSQQREKQIQAYYYEGQKTMNEIVAIMKTSAVFDPPSLYDVRKALGKTGKDKEKNDED